MQTVDIAKDVKPVELNLRFIQKFGDGCFTISTACDFEGCSSRSIALWADPTNKAYALCRKHQLEMKAEEPWPGVEYSPNMALMANWYMQDGKPVYVSPKRWA